MKISAKKSNAAKMNHLPSPKKASDTKKKGGADSFDQMAKKVNGNMDEGQLIKQQEQLQEHARMMTLKSTLIAIEHDMKKSIIANMRY